jgi:hypothetical protein
MITVQDFKGRFHAVFTRGDSADLEFWSGLATLLAVNSALRGVESGEIIFLKAALVTSVLQIVAAFPNRNLIIRHWTNILNAITAFILSYAIYLNHGFSHSGVGGFGTICLMSIYCAFKTRLHFITNRNG